jgi:hypothetical protein
MGEGHDLRAERPTAAVPSATWPGTIGGRVGTYGTDVRIRTEASWWRTRDREVGAVFMFVVFAGLVAVLLVVEAGGKTARRLRRLLFTASAANAELLREAMAADAAAFHTGRDAAREEARLVARRLGGHVDAERYQRAMAAIAAADALSHPLRPPSGTA